MSHSKKARLAIASLRQKLATSSLLPHILAVVSGTAGAQAIVFAFSPLITRIYSPEVYGVQGVFLSLISIFSPVAALRYPMAIVVANDAVSASRIARLSVFIACVMASAAALVLAFAQQPVLRVLGAEALGNLIWFLPVALLAVTLNDVTDYSAARRNAFRKIGVVVTAQAFITNLARVLGGLVSPVAGILVGITSVAPAVQALMLKILSGSKQCRQPRLSSSQNTAQLLYRHRDFPLYRAPTDVLDAIGQTSPVLILSYLFTPAVAGLYVLARSVINLPLNVIGSAVGNVYYTHFAELARKREKLFPAVLKATLIHFSLLGVPMLIVSALFPALFAFVFGEEWRMSGVFAQWMTLWIVGMLSNIPGVRVLPVIGGQRVHLLFNGMIMMGGMAGLFYGHAIHGTPLSAVVWFSIGTAVIYGSQVFAYLWLVRRWDGDMMSAS